MSEESARGTQELTRCRMVIIIFIIMEIVIKSINRDGGNMSKVSNNDINGDDNDCNNNENSNCHKMMIVIIM